LIQLLKSISTESFVSTEAAHSTAAISFVNLFLNFSFCSRFGEPFKPSEDLYNGDYKTGQLNNRLLHSHFNLR